MIICSFKSPSLSFHTNVQPFHDTLYAYRIESLLTHIIYVSSSSTVSNHTDVTKRFRTRAVCTVISNKILYYFAIWLSIRFRH